MVHILLDLLIFSMRSIKGILGVVLLFVLSVSYSQTIVEKNGKLKVIGLQLSNSAGNPVQLRGMSSHGLQWYGSCVTQSSIKTQVDDWGIDIFRIAMYVEEGGYNVDPNANKARIEEIVQWCTDLGIYVMIDWHILADGNPNQNKTAALDFFNYFSNLYKDYDNVLYEICNEPNGNGDNAWSGVIKPYAEDVIDVIRANDPNAIVMVGTPKWSSKPGDPGDDPITGERGKNVMYSFHFYAGSHYTQAYVNNALTKVPVFVTEWGTSHYSGEGGNDYVNAQKWLDLFSGQNDAHVLVSWCNWSYADKDETSGALFPGACGNGNWNNVSESGVFVKNAILNPADVFITQLSSLPVFVIEPQDVLAGKFSTVKLRAKAIANGEITYIWKKNNAVLADEKDSVLVINDFNSDKEGLYSVVAVVNNQSVESSKAQLTLSDQAPFNSTPFQLPGRLEAEDYDLGGAYAGYRDLTEGNSGNAYRQDDVDIQETDDTEGEFNIGWVEDNEYLNYTVEFVDAGLYTIVFRVASNVESGNVYLEIDGNVMTPITPVPNTNGTQNWTDLIIDDVLVTAGVHELRLTAENGGFGINYIDFELKGIVDCAGQLNGTATVDDCGVCGGDNTSCIDCFGVINGGAVEDNCGVCGGDGSTCKDCDGVFGGGAMLDECGICSGGQTGIEPNSICTDCNGDMNGTAAIDACGVCSGGLTGIITNSSCKDCEGVMDGNAILDDCGICTGGTTGIEFNEACKDCEGVLNGDAVVDDCGVCNGNNTSCSGDLTPFKGIRQVIPTRIEAEDYDAGGANTAYYDSDGGNNGNKYRNDNVDIDVNDNGGFAVGWLANNEWLKYSVEIKYSGPYTVIVRSGTPDGGKNYDVSIDNNVIIDGGEASNTGSYSAFATKEYAGINLTAGNAVLEFYSHADGFNLDWMEFVPEFTVDCKGIKNGTSVIDDCGICGGDNTLCKDCAGVVDGTAYVDNCGVCVAGTTNEVPCQIDCNGDWGGTAQLDVCKICSGGQTGRTPETDTDKCVTSFGQSFEDLSILPNPFSSVLNISLEGEFIYRVYTADGVVVLSGSASHDLSFGESLSRGHYILEVISKGTAISQSIIKQ